jgi:hypothetical protein
LCKVLFSWQTYPDHTSLDLSGICAIYIHIKWIQKQNLMVLSFIYSLKTFGLAKLHMPKHLSNILQKLDLLMQYVYYSLNCLLKL